MNTSQKLEPSGLSELQEHLSFDGNTGLFAWRKRGKGRINGRHPGSIFSDGYRQIHVLGRRYCAHHLAWLFITGEWPNGYIDHINGNRADNRISNLRLATNSENCHNRFASRTSQSGFKGIRFKKNRWEVSCQVNGERKYLGRYLALDAAIAAHEAYAKPLIGEFYKI